MHELSIAYEINGIVDQYVKPEQKKLIKSVRVKIGKLQNILPDSLIFCFEALNSAGNYIGPKLEIEQISVAIQCKNCGSINEIDGFAFGCNGCGSTDIKVIRGNELYVTEIELYDDNQEVLN